MSKKLSAILVGVVVLVGVFLSLTSFKDNLTPQSEKVAKKDSNQSTVSEVSEADLAENKDKEKQSTDNGVEEDVNEELNNKFTEAKEVSPKDNNNNESETGKDVPKSTVKETEDANESVKINENENQENTAIEVIEESTSRQQIVANNSRKAPVSNKEVEKAEEESPSNQQPSVPNTTESQSIGHYLSDVEQLILQKVNAERTNAGLSALSNNATMQKYARIKSADMGDRGYFAHESPDGDLITTAMQQGGVSYQAWGENIAYIGGVSGAETLAAQFMTNWMNSSGHRANILSTDYDSIGIGVYQIGDTVYATQEFMR